VEEASTLALSLKLTLSSSPTYEAALKLLESFSTALFFDIDLLYGTSVSLAESKLLGLTSSTRRRLPSSITLPTAPRNSYSFEAASLYTYGRAANGMPLLQYLAFYQVLEFYFPTYSRSETVRRFQRRIKDPAFDPNNNSQVANLVAFLNSESRALQYGEEQLKATLDACIDNEALERFFDESEDCKEFLSKKNALKGVNHLTFNGGSNVPPLVTQVATRIYQLRCRIVHAKEDGGPRGVNLLLPYSAEAKMLRHDIRLVQWAAQRALIQGAERCPW
jgi:hypothetical protein